jgi:hypothetical protein
VGGRALGRQARHRVDRQRHRERHAARRDDRASGPHGGVGPGHARLDVRVAIPSPAPRRS